MNWFRISWDRHLNKNVKTDIYYPGIRLSLWIMSARNYVNFELHCQLTKNWFWRFCFRSRTIIYLIVIFLILPNRIIYIYFTVIFFELLVMVHNLWIIINRPCPTCWLQKYHKPGESNDENKKYESTNWSE